MMITIIQNFLSNGSNPFTYNEWSKDMLSKEDRRIIGILEQLPQKLPTKYIVRVYLSPKSVADLCGIYRLAYNLSIF